MFKKIGDCCGGFVAIDENIAFLVHLQWPRIRVNMGGCEMPRLLEVIVGSSTFFDSIVVGSPTQILNHDSER